ncbi:MAG: hypothetical protein HPY76_12735 [Anaerolineae bacterium]|nr:hypothetical protein [Anaerolineae bacterium]
MITNYSRPSTLEEAYQLMQNKELKAIALAGGSSVVQHRFSGEQLALVDLQSLGLDSIEIENNVMRIGAMARLNDIMNLDGIAPNLQQAIYLETNFNLRNSATIGGTILSGGDTCPLVTALLAMDAQLVWYPGNKVEPLSDWMLRKDDYIGMILTAVHVQMNTMLAFEYISRSPADKVALCIAICAWSSGRIRVAISGSSPQPILAMDGPNSAGVEVATQNAYSQYTSKHNNPIYTKQMISLLTNRTIASLRVGGAQ